MKTKKKTTVAIAALMGMTTAINPAFPTVHAKSMNDQNPTESQTDVSTMDQAQAEDSQTQQDLTYSKDAQEASMETPVTDTLETPAVTDVQEAVENKNIEINETTFPDSVFRSWIIENVTGAKDRILTPEEIAAVDKIIIYGDTATAYKTITNLNGIEYFTQLTNLNVLHTNLTEMNLTANTKLRVIICQSNKIENVVLPAGDTLTYVNLSDNNLNSIDVSNNPKIDTLNISQNQLINLNLKKNEKLQNLYCSSNLLTTLDVSTNAELKVLSVAENKEMQSINLEKNINLQNLTISNTNISSLNVLHNTKLSSLRANDCNLTSLSLPKSDIKMEIYIRGSQLESLDLSGIPNLTLLDCNSSNRLSTLILNTNNSQLQTLKCSGTKLQFSNLSLFPNLEELEISNTDLTSLDVTMNKKLEKLNCSNNINLKSINLLNNPEITELWIHNTSISEFDGSGNSKLVNLFASDNEKLQKLNLKKNTSLKNLYVYKCNLSTIDLTKNTNLENIDLQHNKLTSLDISMNKNLKNLNCSFNQLTILDASENEKLEKLFCLGNKIVALDLSQNTKVNHDSNRLETKISEISLSANNSLDLKNLFPYLSLEQLNSIRNIKNGRIEGTTLYVENPKNQVSFEYPCGGLYNVILEVNLYITGGIYWSSDLSIENWKFGEEPKVPSAKVNTDASIQYSYSDKEDGTYVTDTDNLFTHAGTWYVKAIATDPTYGTISTIKSFEILKAAPKAIEAPTNVKGISGILLSSITLPDGWAWQDATQIVKVKNDGYKAFYKVDDMNYDYSNVEGYDKTNHCITKVLSITASKAENAWVKEISTSDWTQDETAILPTAQSRYGTVSFLYSNSKTGAFTSEAPNTAGTWYVKAIVSEGDEYLGLVSDMISFTIKEPEKEDTENTNDKSNHNTIDVNKPSTPIDEVKKEATPSPIQPTGDTASNPAKLLLVFLTGCLACFKKKVSEE